MMMDHKINTDKLKQGDPVTFKVFFERFYPRLMGLACRFVDEQTARDIVQEVFASYWERREEIEAANIQSYLYRWVQNSCLNHLKHQRVVDEYEANIRIAEARIAFLQNTTDTSDLFNEFVKQDIIERVKEALSKLPTRSAEAFHFFYFRELSHKEIAEEMQISPRTVEGHIRQAVLHLRKSLRHLITSLLSLYFIFYISVVF